MSTGNCTNFKDYVKYQAVCDRLWKSRIEAQAREPQDVREQLLDSGYSDVRVLPTGQIISDTAGMACNCRTAEKPQRCEPLH